jgi:hypothetical protein
MNFIILFYFAFFAGITSTHAQSKVCLQDADALALRESLFQGQNKQNEFTSYKCAAHFSQCSEESRVCVKKIVLIFYKVKKERPLRYEVYIDSKGKKLSYDQAQSVLSTVQSAEAKDVGQ